MTIRTWTCFAFVLLMVQVTNAQGVPSSARGEAAKLRLQGEVVELHLLEQDQRKTKFRLKLKLNIVNEGNKSAILLQQDLVIGAKMLAASREDAYARKYLYKSAAWPSVSLAPEWARWREQLDSATPQQKHIWILRPGESLPFETSTTMYIETAGNFDRTNRPWDEIKQNTRWLQVQIKTWPTNLEPKHDPERPEFGEALRQRWDSFGDLELAHLTSEPMPLTFPQQ